GERVRQATLPRSQQRVVFPETLGWGFEPQNTRLGGGCAIRATRPEHRGRQGLLGLRLSRPREPCLSSCPASVLDRGELRANRIVFSSVSSRRSATTRNLDTNHFSSVLQTSGSWISAAPSFKWILNCSPSP